MKFNFGERLYLLYRVGLCLFALGLVLNNLTENKDLGLLAGYAGLTILAVAFFVGLKEFIKNEVPSIKEVKTQMDINELEFAIKDKSEAINGIVVKELADRKIPTGKTLPSFYKTYFPIYEQIRKATEKKRVLNNIKNDYRNNNKGEQE